MSSKTFIAAAAALATPLLFLATVADTQTGPVGMQFAAAALVANTTDGGAISSAAGDLDGDGRDEIVTIASKSSTSPHFRIYDLDSGMWTVHDVLTPTEVQSRPDRFGGDSELADLDGDGWIDILVTQSKDGTGAGKVLAFHNPGAAGLGAPWVEQLLASWPDSSFPDQPQSVRHMADIDAGDLDDDGDLDIVTRDIANGVFIIENLGGSFLRHFVSASPREGLALIDVDRDDDLDVLLNGVWLEAPDLGFNHSPDLSDTAGYIRHDVKNAADVSSPWYPAGNSAEEIADFASKVIAADLDGDGRTDVAITNAEELMNAASTDSKPKGLRIYLVRDSSGIDWDEHILLGSGFDLHTLDAADVDGDGDLDLLSGVSTVGAGNSAPEIFVFVNGGDGTSWEQVALEELNIYSGVFADLDGNGMPDIVGPDNWNDGAIRVLENTMAPPPPAPALRLWASLLGILGMGAVGSHTLRRRSRL